MKIRTLCSVLVFSLTGCLKTTTMITTGQSQQAKASYKAVSAHQLFQSKFKKVYLFCAGYVEDKENVASDTPPSVTFDTEVFPSPAVLSWSDISSTNLNVTISFDSSLDTASIQSGGVTIGQDPLVRLKGSIRTRFSSEGTLISDETDDFDKPVLFQLSNGYGNSIYSHTFKYSSPSKNSVGYVGIRCGLKGTPI